MSSKVDFYVARVQWNGELNFLPSSRPPPRPPNYQILQKEIIDFCLKLSVIEMGFQHVQNGHFIREGNQTILP